MLPASTSLKEQVADLLHKYLPDPRIWLRNTTHGGGGDSCEVSRGQVIRIPSRVMNESVISCQECTEIQGQAWLMRD